ncbi:hypothetical protein [Bosea lathyri]|uniref:DUF2946 domain-containing protein n=1 Tax=Bosea lathyri TaxID=1036778 RepID=A0A1H5ZZZ5_9HYPH|nr:hypothetical protein [Bosea lathyri]SEG42049.1 hypothetical protein SAMN04488115_105128 [Bosea lathyri]
MSARATAFTRLRRSVLGAWLAVAYALAVLATGLATVPALAAHPALQGITLCSGSAVPGDETPAPLSEQTHCMGCPLNPILLVPTAPQFPTIAQTVAPVALSLPLQHGLPRGATPGLPRSRAPPAGLA